MPTAKGKETKVKESLGYTIALTQKKKKRVVKSISSLGGTYLILIFRTMNVEYRELKVNLTIARLSQKP